MFRMLPQLFNRTRLIEFLEKNDSRNQYFVVCDEN